MSRYISRSMAEMGRNIISLLLVPLMIGNSPAVSGLAMVHRSRIANPAVASRKVNPLLAKVRTNLVQLQTKTNFATREAIYSAIPHTEFERLASL